MKRFLAVLVVIAAPTFAQAVDYTCLGASGLGIMSNAVPNDAAAPTQCRLLQNGVQVASAPVVLASTLPVNMISTCVPTRPVYNPGVAGSVACFVGTGNLSPGTYTYVWYSSNAQGETGPSPATVIQVVTALPTTPPVLAKPIQR